MERRPVTSSNITEIAYSDDQQILELLFTSGMRYQYFDVPRRIFEEACAADSIGRYVNANIKGQFRYARV
jgi:hypothetical protein